MFVNSYSGAAFLIITKSSESVQGINLPAALLGRAPGKAQWCQLKSKVAGTDLTMYLLSLVFPFFSPKILALPLFLGDWTFIADEIK